MSLSPLSAESEDNLRALYSSVEGQYFLVNSNNDFLGSKSLNLIPRIVEPTSSYVLEVELDAPPVVEFIKAYKDHYMWFSGSPVERITHGDKAESVYSKLWTLLDNFYEDAARQYQRLFNLGSLFGMFEVFDICSTNASLNNILLSTRENYKLVCLANFSSTPIKNCFINYPEIEFKSNFVYLFPSSFTHKVNLPISEDNLLVFVGGFA